MRMTWLADVLRAAGLTVVETAGWQTRGRDTMRPLVVIGHHTATSASTSDANVVALLIKGRSDLPGPLCHLGLDRQGRYHIIAAGKANHAGAGVWKEANESSETIGIEAFNFGNSVPFPTREPWPQVQLDAYDRGVAALLTHIGRDASYFCGHREWAQPPGRKPDPSGIDLPLMRTRIAAIMEPMTLTQARIEVAAAWHSASGEWMTPTPTETRQVRLSRLAKEVITPGGRTAAQIAAAGVPTPPPDLATRLANAVNDPLPAWVTDPAIPQP